MNVLDKLFEIRKGADVDLEKLARSIANGEDPGHDATTLDDALRAQGVRLQDFARMVSKHEARNKLRGQITQADEREQRRQELQVALEMANAILEEAVAHHRETTAPIQRELEHLRYEPNTPPSSARTELIQSCPSFELRSRLSDSHLKYNTASKRFQTLGELLSTKQSEAQDARTQGQPVQHLREQLQSLETEREQLKQSLGVLTDQIADLERQMVDY